ncbi:MAG TPA: hypothetical protein VJ204_10605, partial [Solirubrobacterales bacterium]|nr:hypothetical protein [Solirubrobacterales bacterium]
GATRPRAGGQAKANARAMTRRQRLLRVYARLGRTYWAWAPKLLALAAVVFIPLGLVDALLNEVETSSLNVTDGLHVAALIGAVAAVTASSLFGEVFFSGAIAASLTHPEDEEAPSFRRLASHISYGKLIVVDILYVVITALGLIAFVIPGVVALVYLSLAGPVVELEKHSVIGGFKRSLQIVRGHFWMVAAVVIPIETVGDTLNELIVDGVHGALGHGLIPAWIGEAVGNIATAPVFSVAIVLLTLDLIHARDGTGPVLKRRPEPVTAGDAA